MQNLTTYFTFIISTLIASISLTNFQILPSSKHMVQETRTGDYMSVLTLTVRELRAQDFGGYICASVNALGKAEGGIRLQGLISLQNLYYRIQEYNYIRLYYNLYVLLKNNLLSLMLIFFLI